MVSTIRRRRNPSTEPPHMAIENHWGKRPKTRDHLGQGQNSHQAPPASYTATHTKNLTATPQKNAPHDRKEPQNREKWHTHHYNSTSRPEATKTQKPKKKTLTQVLVSGLSNPKAPKSHSLWMACTIGNNTHTPLSRHRSPQPCKTPPRNQPQIPSNDAVYDTDKAQSTPQPDSPRHWPSTPVIPNNHIQRAPKKITTPGSLPLHAAPTAPPVKTTNVTLKKK